MGKKKVIKEGFTPKELESRLKHIDVGLRAKASKKAGRAGCKPVLSAARARLPKKGYPGDKPDKKDLRTSYAIKVKQYQYGAITVALVGARISAPWKAHHAHLAEEGHKVLVSRGSRKGAKPLTGKSIVPGRRDLQQAVDSNRSTSHSAVLLELSSFFAANS